MPIMRKMNRINVHFWTYTCKGLALLWEILTCCMSRWARRDVSRLPTWFLAIGKLRTHFDLKKAEKKKNAKETPECFLLRVAF